MSSTLSALKDTLARFEVAVGTREHELQEFRVRASEFEKHLEQEIERERATISILKKEIAARELNPARPIISPLASQAQESNPKKAHKNRTEAIRSAAKEVLQIEGRVMSRSEIMAKMQELGLTFDSANAAELVRQALNRSSEFKHISGVGYELVKR